MSRTEETGETDIEVLLPTDSLLTAWASAMQAGDKFGMRVIGTHAREALRLEAGLPKAGPDLNEEIVPPEANLEEKAFSLNKGCYPGQEVVARMDTYGNVRRKLVGLVLKDSIVPTHGAKLYSGDREVGWVSSAVRSPQLNKTIAFGFPLRDFSKPGTDWPWNSRAADFKPPFKPCPSTPNINTRLHEDICPLVNRKTGCKPLRIKKRVNLRESLAWWTSSTSIWIRCLRLKPSEACIPKI